MRSGGGAWLKHTGHKHWKETLRRCVPTSLEEAIIEQQFPEAFCKQQVDEMAEVE
jgi:hypothetical protein